MDPETGVRISEALRVQLDVQRRLHEQLETQRSLQVRIEEQGKRLQRMFEDQLKASGNIAPAPSPEPDDGVIFQATEHGEPLFVDSVDVQLLSVAGGSYDEKL